MGLVRTVIRYPLVVLGRLGRLINRRRDLGFDSKLGIETEGFEIGPAALMDHMGPYAATPTKFFGRIIRATRIDPKQFAFIDLGSGKGRTLLLAADHGFPSVVGVEFDEALCVVARENIDRVAAGHGVRPTVVQADARNAQFPEGNLFVFMFNPFSGPIFADVANHLAAAARESRPVIVAYNNDKCGDVLEQTGAFRRVRLKPLKFWTPPTMSIFYNDLAWKMRG